MGDMKKIQGTPWHVEVLGRNEGDERRHRSRCVHYDVNTKMCTYRDSWCFGSRHCDWYKEFQKTAQTTSTPMRSEPAKRYMPDTFANNQLIHQAYLSLQRILVNERELSVFCEINKVLMLKMNITLPGERKAFLQALKKRVGLPTEHPQCVRTPEGFRQFILAYDPAKHAR